MPPATTSFPDADRYQPQCDMPQWDDSCFPAPPWRGLPDPDGAGCWEFWDATRARDVYEDLEAVLGEHTTHTATGPEETRELTGRLVPALRQLTDYARLLVSAGPGTEAHRALRRARSLLHLAPPTEPLPALAHLRRVALATLDLLELTGDAP
ncbi:DUF6415 family natural product biosynthesis protein [Streptomyces syringium]|uniref:Uncharacterized protein n=1 Tax=Streptomyces syringium TaxID=76729 RepID=A0ABS4XW48_9ACTN|nr:DUF6415 family natural product biosynthesis protein [Streptomyces syringium]MBP2400739.1 hypothetical protein [Streptomyces syringium]